MTAHFAAAGSVRARVLSVYPVFFFGSMALGSIAWGAIASMFTMPHAFVSAALLAITGTVANRWLPLSSTEGLDPDPSLHWPKPHLEAPAEGGKGTVRVTVAYPVDPDNEEAFCDAAHTPRAIRLRASAVQWHLFKDRGVLHPDVEVFMIGSWLHHLRRHEHVTASDPQVQEKVRSSAKDGADPVGSQFMAERTHGKIRSDT